MSPLDKITEAARREADAYRAGEHRRLGSYVATMGTYAASVAALVGAGALAGRRLPERISPYDVTLLGVATHKLSRRVAKDSVTAPLRAPFTEFAGPQGQGELHEDVRGHGLRHTIGELITCPFCLGQWVATGLVLGVAVVPRATRLVTSVFTALTAADFLQLAYAAAEQRAT